MHRDNLNPNYGGLTVPTSSIWTPRRGLILPGSPDWPPGDYVPPRPTMDPEWPERPPFGAPYGPGLWC